jgi:hypothetical protein
VVPAFDFNVTLLPYVQQLIFVAAQAKSSSRIDAFFAPAQGSTRLRCLC